MGADAESSCTESRTDSWAQDGARNPWSAPTIELWAPTGATTLDAVASPTAMTAITAPAASATEALEPCERAILSSWWQDGFG